MADAAPEQPRLSGQVPLYKNPQPLNRQIHKDFGLTAPKKPYEFLRSAHFVPAIVGEFGLAAGSFPIIFIGEKHVPVIVMGMNNGGNLFVTDDGEYDKEAMMPAFLRRYPFVSASTGDDKPATVCVDVDAESVTDKKPDFPFFDANGEPTDIVKQAIEFVSAFETDARTTELFVQRLMELDLFERKEVSIADQTDRTKQHKVAEYFGVDEKKLLALPTETFIELRDSGHLGAIYAHLISLSRWDRIIHRGMQKTNVKPDAAAKPAKPAAKKADKK